MRSTKDLSDDERFMQIALRLARKGRGKTSPNPMVGAVVVRDGQIVGDGYHRRAGEMHAEPLALRQAGAAAKGATLYVNLEPCCHFGRTPPCSEEIIKAGIRRVVVGMVDPNPVVDGAGIERLKKTGIEVTCGVLKEACEDLNRDFALFVREKRPRITLKSAMTLDGKTATRTGKSRWITGSEARHFAHRLRAQNDAIIVGVGTVLNDDPDLTCRHVRGRNPTRVVVDSALRTPLTARVVRTARDTPTWIFTTDRAADNAIARFTDAGVAVKSVTSRNGHVCVDAMLTALAQHGTVSALLEGGATLAGSFWRAHKIDSVVTVFAPKLFGDTDAVGMIAGPPVNTMDQAATLKNTVVRRFGSDVAISGDVYWP